MLIETVEAVPVELNIKGLPTTRPCAFVAAAVMMAVCTALAVMVSATPAGVVEIAACVVIAVGATIEISVELPGEAPNVKVVAPPTSGTTVSEPTVVMTEKVQ